MSADFDAAGWRDKLSDELLENIVPFWLEHSPDAERGGYFNCLDRDGAVYDTTKHVWMQCRTVWMFSRLYNRLDQRPEWLDAARLGAEFITAHAVSPDNRVYFSLDRDGRPAFIQRKPFSECFYAMALDEYARAANDDRMAAEGLAMFERMVELTDNPGLLGRPRLPGAPDADSLAVPMMLLCAADQFRDGRGNFPFEDRLDGWVRRVLLHIDRERELVLENVSPDGSRLPGADGRLINPGHAIEAGWFLLEHLQSRGIEDHRADALAMIDWSFERGWDGERGGIFYFLDSEDYSPAPLEWSMKLWWPLCEALYGALLAYHITGENRWLERFTLVWDYIDNHLRDPRCGEWFGYLDRDGRPTHRFKGAPYKSFFHVPRALLLCILLLDQIRD